MASVTVADTIDAYAEDALSRGLSEGSVRIQVTYLRRLAASCGSRPVASLSPADISAIRGHCKGNSDRNNLRWAIKGYLAWCVRMRYIKAAKADSLMDSWKSLKATRKPKYYIKSGDFPAFLDAAEAWHPRSRAVIAFALYTLGRQGELRLLKLKHLDLMERTLVMWRPKLQRWTDMPVGPELYEEAQAWLAWYAEKTGCSSAAAMIAEHPDWYLLPKMVQRNPRDTREFRLEPEAPAYRLEHVVKRALDGIGVTTTEHGRTARHLQEGIHTIRRSGARAMLDHLSGEIGSDKALLQVSLMLDHEDTRITLVYIGIDIERERLNTWLRSNSMYGTARQGESASVTELRRRTA